MSVQACTYRLAIECTCHCVHACRDTAAAAEPSKEVQDDKQCHRDGLVFLGMDVDDIKSAEASQEERGTCIVEQDGSTPVGKVAEGWATQGGLFFVTAERASDGIRPPFEKNSSP